MTVVNKEQVWAKWEEGRYFPEGYILNFYSRLQVSGYDLEIDNTGDLVMLGWSDILITDESWIENKGELSLPEHIQMDFNYEINWNEVTQTEFLEDALISTGYGKDNGTKGTVALLNKIEIYEDYRGNSLFPVFLQSILARCRKLKVDYVVLQACPYGGNRLEKDELEVAKLKLRTFYEKFGFHEYPSDRETPYMMLDLKLVKGNEEV